MRDNRRSLTGNPTAALFEQRQITTWRDLAKDPTAHGSFNEIAGRITAQWPGARRLDRSELVNHLMRLYDLTPH